jgi:hypothetical protein
MLKATDPEPSFEKENKFIQETRDEILTLLQKKLKNEGPVYFTCICKSILSAYLAVLFQEIALEDRYGRINADMEEIIETLGSKGLLIFPKKEQK